jgi:hypothetical protein
MIYITILLISTIIILFITTMIYYKRYKKIKSLMIDLYILIQCSIKDNKIPTKPLNKILSLIRTIKNEVNLIDF